MGPADRRRGGGKVDLIRFGEDTVIVHKDRAEPGSYVGCFAGALSEGEYDAGLAAARFGEVW